MRRIALPTSSSGTAIFIGSAPGLHRKWKWHRRVGVDNMTSFGSGFRCSALGLLAAIVADKAFAGAPGGFGQYAPGMTFGIPSGAAPPPGRYLDNLLQLAPAFTAIGQLSGLKV